MRSFILLLVLAFVGCDVTELPKQPQFDRDALRPAKQGKVVVVSRNGCVWCDRQKAALRSLRPAGWDIYEVNHSIDVESRKQYPASVYPTMYICWESGRCLPVEGFQDEEQLRDILSR